MEHPVGFRLGEYTLSFQHVVEMRLGNSGVARQAAFSGRTAANPLAKLFEETLLQIVECHGLALGLFLAEIGYK